MRQAMLGRPTRKFVPLPAELGRTANYNFARKPIRDVPFVSTPHNVVAEMLRAANVTSRDVVYDLGCGDGRIVIAAAQRCGARGVGVDIDPRRIEESKLNAINAGVSDRAQFLNTSLFNVDLTDATVVTLYLLPWMNAMLRPRLLAELRPGARIVAHAFSLGHWTPDRVIRMPNERIVYLWVVPAAVKGTWQCALRTSDGVLRHGTMDFEQEYQTVVGRAVIDGNETPIERIVLSGRRMSFRIGDVSYYCTVDGDSLRGAGGMLEVRARRV